MRDGQILATVDLGSNSFRLEMARLDHGQLVRLDYYKEPVRLGAGLDENGCLTKEAIERGVACLGRFAERLRGVHPDAVRAVATQSLRSAKNPDAFLEPAQAALGYPIDIISGQEEARLIYQGMANDLPKDHKIRLAVDIGGGSTELIVGVNADAHRMESMRIGCVSHTLRFFNNNKVTAKAFEKAVIAAAAVFEEVGESFDSAHWQVAYGSSGTIETIAHLCAQLNGGTDKITRAGLDELAHIVTTTDAKKWPFTDLKAARAQVLVGGLAVLTGLFQAFRVSSMTPCYSALRQGVMADLLGRDMGDDVREQSISRLAKRWSADHAQAMRVHTIALDLLAKIRDHLTPSESQWLAWSARVHEVGMAISHEGFHRHGEYIVQNAELAGFSRAEQTHLAQLVLGQRGGLRKSAALLAQPNTAQELLCLRLAALLCHARIDIRTPLCTLAFDGRIIHWHHDPAWAEKFPLSAYLLEEEWRTWEKTGVKVNLKP
ncbi:Ppx/GppA phosphatase family protein [Hydromonas duriensis]|uniref:Exopolyphosphatase/guanosine-5'-triphosphate, 3'-diphosphate pyrophosphatase n=1 Tax=Hydromonas duriensis TaxID=1527608 RepID=A0A4R6Y7E2_9BURK|nr:Ppx/GppA phosphatase family protein [Hydromonas duriensis]TDR31250.1 exopolyphosphatase/guanosine-5'-triphosphate,3'-diphosphate pyrophosphatase [Hydromonas duriensis]